MSLQSTPSMIDANYLYAYVQNDPLNLIDPSGPVDITLAYSMVGVSAAQQFVSPAK
jgi:hypothetical protein